MRLNMFFWQANKHDVMVIACQSAGPNEQLWMPATVLATWFCGGDLTCFLSMNDRSVYVVSLKCQIQLTLWKPQGLGWKPTVYFSLQQVGTIFLEVYFRSQECVDVCVCADLCVCPLLSIYLKSQPLGGGWCVCYTHSWYIGHTLLIWPRVSADIIHSHKQNLASLT